MKRAWQWSYYILLAVMASTGHPRSAAAEGFALKDANRKHLDVLLDGHVIARYMYEYDTSTKQKRDETYKPYLHVFDAEGTTPITKGPGGEFTHHRGIFIGWMRIGFQGKTFDRWHMKGGEIVHQKFPTLESDPEHARFTSLTHWNTPEGQAIVEEDRTMTFRRAPAPGRLFIDFTSTLSAPNGDVTLAGDPEHAGIQYRPSNDVDRAKTVYVFPKEKADAHKDRDYPWVGETYTLAGKQYSVVDFNHPDNPKQTVFSAYRNYGRFGAYFVATIKQGQSLTVKYRFLITEGAMPSVAMIQQCCDDFAGATTPTPVPKATVKPAEQPAAKPAAKDAKSAKFAKPKK